MRFQVVLIGTALLPFIAQAQQSKEISPYIDLVFCPARPQPWGCARQQAGRILDLWDEQVDANWQKLKVEADQQFNASLERRGYSLSEPLTKEKPSTILKKIEIGTNFMKDYLAQTFDGFLGREYGYGAVKGEDELASDEFVDVEVTRGKKKKKRKAIMKLVLLGTFLKAKIELLLKILGAHLQVKFLAIAFIGLLINLARFWIDLKRGGTPQKVVYVEHAHHQHHYEDHGEDWGEQAGGYWKRSIQNNPPKEEASEEAAPSYQVPTYDPHFMAYRSQLV